MSKNLFEVYLRVCLGHMPSISKCFRVFVCSVMSVNGDAVEQGGNCLNHFNDSIAVGACIRSRKTSMNFMQCRNNMVGCLSHTSHTSQS